MHLSYVLDIGIHVGGLFVFGLVFLLLREMRLVLSCLRLSGFRGRDCGWDNLESLKEKEMKGHGEQMLETTPS